VPTQCYRAYWQTAKHDIRRLNEMLTDVWVSTVDTIPQFQRLFPSLCTGELRCCTMENITFVWIGLYEYSFFLDRWQLLYCGIFEEKILTCFLPNKDRSAYWGSPYCVCACVRACACVCVCVCWCLCAAPPPFKCKIIWQLSTNIDMNIMSLEHTLKYLLIFPVSNKGMEDAWNNEVEGTIASF
jgi:hypothetical protein